MPDGRSLSTQSIAPEQVAIAIANGEIQPWFQPKVSLLGGAVVDAETNRPHCMCCWPNPMPPTGWSLFNCWSVSVIGRRGRQRAGRHRGAGAQPLRPDPDGRDDAGNGWFDRHKPDPRVRMRRGVHSDRGTDRQRWTRASHGVPGGWHGRGHHQAGHADEPAVRHRRWCAHGRKQRG